MSLSIRNLESLNLILGLLVSYCKSKFVESREFSVLDDAINFWLNQHLMCLESNSRDIESCNLDGSQNIQNHTEIV